MSKVESWVWKDEETKVSVDKESVVFPFSFYGLTANNLFSIKKPSMIKRLKIITDYINYFRDSYDKDNHIINVYNAYKNDIDFRNVPDDEALFAHQFFTELFNDNMISKVKQMVDDCIIKSDTRQRISKFSEINDRNLMIISLAIKLVLPMICHYDTVYKGNSNKNLYEYFSILFTKFDLLDLHNQLHTYIVDKVVDNYHRNNATWKKKEVFPVDVSKKMFEQDIITSTIFKFDFDKCATNYVHIVALQSLKYFIASL